MVVVGKKVPNAPGPKAEASAPPVRYGDARGGFEIFVDASDRTVHMKLRGIWDIATAEAFCSTIRGIGKGLSARPWAILADSREFSAQSPDVARLRQETMTKLRALRCEKIAVVAASAVYAMQFKRISVDSHVGGGVFPDEKSALEWIRRGRDEGPATGQNTQPVSAIHPVDPRRKL
jgi:hypothetical protein